MASLMFYEDVAVLDRQFHRDLKLKPVDNLSFAAGVPAIPIVVGEFADVAREYPIAFLHGKHGSLLPVALTGMRDGENRYVDDRGKWHADYIPAFVRRYPFVFAETGTERLIVCIDETWPGFDEEEGEPLFDGGGEPTATLRGIFDLLADYQRQVALTENFTGRLAQAGLLVDAQAHAGQAVAMLGFKVVDEAKFRAIPEATLKEWFGSGEIGLVYAHLMSLRNMRALARREQARRA